MDTSYRPKAAGALIMLAPLLAAAACGQSTSHAAAPTTTPVTAKPTPVPLTTRASLASARSFSGTYSVTDTSHTTVTAQVWVIPHSYRVEVVAGGQTAALYGSPSGTVACPEFAGHSSVCYLVAKAGQPVPATYDAGIERVFTRDLPALATTSSSFRIARATPPAALAAVWKGLACYSVKVPSALSSRVDSGTYCLGTDGTPVQMRFATGTLTLTKVGARPTAAVVRAPVHPRALPTAD